MATPDDTRDALAAERLSFFIVPRSLSPVGFLSMSLRQWIGTLVEASPSPSPSPSSPATPKRDELDLTPRTKPDAAQLLLQTMQTNDITDAALREADPLLRYMNAEGVLRVRKNLLDENVPLEQRQARWRRYASFVLASAHPVLAQNLDLFEGTTFPYLLEQEARATNAVLRPTSVWRSMLVATAAVVSPTEADALLGEMPEWYEFPTGSSVKPTDLAETLTTIFNKLRDPVVSAFAAAWLDRFDLLEREGVAALPLTSDVMEAWTDLRDKAKKFNPDDLAIAIDATTAISNTPSTVRAARNAAEAAEVKKAEAFDTAAVDYGINAVFAAYLSGGVDYEDDDTVPLIVAAAQDVQSVDFVRQVSNDRIADVYLKRHVGTDIAFFETRMPKLYTAKKPAGAIVSYFSDLSKRPWEKPTPAWQTNVEDAVSKLRKPDDININIRLYTLSQIRREDVGRIINTRTSEPTDRSFILIADDAAKNRLPGLAVLHIIGKGTTVYLTAATPELQERVAERLTNFLKQISTSTTYTAEEYALWPGLNITSSVEPNAQTLSYVYNSAMYVSLWIVEMVAHGFTASELEILPALFQNRKGDVAPFYNYIVTTWARTRFAAT